jgi:hypothetical protein
LPTSGPAEAAHSAVSVPMPVMLFAICTHDLLLTVHQ